MQDPSLIATPHAHRKLLLLRSSLSSQHLLDLAISGAALPRHRRQPRSYSFVSALSSSPAVVPDLLPEDFRRCLRLRVAAMSLEPSGPIHPRYKVCSAMSCLVRALRDLR